MHTLNTLLVILILALSNNTLSATCLNKNAKIAHSLQAQYQIKVKHKGKKERKRSLTLWRHKSQVAIQYPETKIVELWEQTTTGRLLLVRYFMANQRGIEYQPTEINQGRGETDWSLKRQLISNKLINAMTLKKTQTKQCQKQQLYTLKLNQTKQKLTWLPEEELIKNYSVKTSQGTEHWKLENLNTETQDIAAFFAQLQTFQTTDYTDIGDNETDPFLQKMIHLGFIEHSHSGFYQAPQQNASDNNHHQAEHSTHNH